MIKIVPDKEGRLTQWDLNRKVIVTGYEGVAEVHFASPGDDHGAYVVKLVDGQAGIPNILLTMAGTINVYVYPADRTVFATALWVMAREKPDDYVYTETEVLDWRRLDEKIGDLAELTTTAKENLVAAINEAATKGMASIYMRVANGYIEYSGDGMNWKQLIAVAELKGEKGDKGDPGSDATVDIVTPTAESTDTQAASAKAVWDMLGGGGSGTDISLGVTGALVGDIIKVKAVDASGKPTAWETAGYTLLSESTGISEAVAMFEFTGLIGYNDFVLVANMPKASGSARYHLYINNRRVSSSLGNYFLHPTSPKNVILGVACNFIDKHYMTYGAGQEQNSPYNQDTFGVSFGQTLLGDNESIESLKIASDKSDVLIPAQTSYKFYGRYINA